MDNNAMRFQLAIVDPNTVTVPRDEYDDLICARNAIQLIGLTLGRYSPNDDIVRAVCKQFGYEYKEPEPEDHADAE